ncbi:hypothetical protein KCU67_g13706, partial [Aureobasidium melanogenum]
SKAASSSRSKPTASSSGSKVTSSSSSKTTRANAANDTHANCTPLLDDDDDDSRSLAGQMAYETDLLNMSPASSTGETAGPAPSASSVLSASSAVHDEPLRKRQRTSRFGQLDYKDAHNTSGSEYEQANDSDSETTDITDKPDIADESDIIPSPPPDEAAFPSLHHKQGKGKHECPLCHEEFPSAESLEYHLENSTESYKNVTRAILKRATASIDKDLESAAATRLGAAIGKHYGPPLREILSRTASEFAENDDDDARFQCPVPACGKVLRAQATLAVLWNHCNDAAHQ